jgi:choline dehydrogenase-like flavoprotein
VADFDIIVIGTGPTGISAAIPLAEAGLKLAIVDSGEMKLPPAYDGDWLAMRTQDPSQAFHLVGREFEALRGIDAPSPKFRVPRLRPVFDRFHQVYRIAEDGVVVNGSLATGGLSNAWGAGVACYDDLDLADFPLTQAMLAPSFRRVVERIGVAGAHDDDLSSFFGSGLPLQPANQLSPRVANLLDRFRRRPEAARRVGLSVGRARNAVLTAPLSGRQGCNACGQCLTGCSRGAIYNANYDLTALAGRGNVSWHRAVVETLQPIAGGWAVLGESTENRQPASITARHVVLACGPIGSAAVVLRSLGSTTRVQLLSNPTSAFALLLPAQIGAAIEERFFGLAQISFTLTWASGADGYAFGNVFTTDGIPVSEFVRRAPISRAASVRLLRRLLPAMLVANCFYPASLSRYRAGLNAHGHLEIVGGFSDQLHDIASLLRQRLARAFRSYAAMMLPGSFTIAPAGTDMHYAGTLPMRPLPGPCETSCDGELGGLPGVFVVDASVFPSLSAKPHTLTAMANADRVAHHLLDLYK